MIPYRRYYRGRGVPSRPLSPEEQREVNRRVRWQLVPVILFPFVFVAMIMGLAVWLAN